MTKEQQQFHERMNAEIKGALDGLRHEFDIQTRDLGPEGVAELDVIKGNLKELLFKAYARNHSWVEG